MTTIDLSPLYRTFIGTEHLAHLLNLANNKNNQKNYPPYNIEAVDDDTYNITIAVAGFAKENITIETSTNSLVITGKLCEKSTTQQRFLHKGISNRDFKRTFQLNDHVEVTGADMENGLLTITLKHIVPEESKPKLIPIQSKKPT